MKKAFLQFLEQVVSNDCPFLNFSVNLYRSYIEVRFIIATSVFPDDLGWLNTHLIGGRWFVSSENDTVILVVRFDENEED